MVPFESALERDFITFVAGFRELHRVTSQPITVRWFDGRRTRRYTPDFKVELTHISPELQHLDFAQKTFVEVKYEDEVEINRDVIFSRLEAVTASEGCPAIIADESVIGGTRIRKRA